MNIRREIIINYSRYDLLDLHRDEPCVIESIFRHESKRVQEFAGRLVNILTLDYYGRNYLLSSDKLISNLVSTLKKEVKKS